MEPLHYTIIGGGIAGLTAAIALKRIGITAHVFEASDVIKPVGAGLGLGINAMKALRSIDLDEKVAQIGQPLKSFSILDERGVKISHAKFSPIDGRFGVAVHRAELHAVLMSQLDPATIHTGKRLSNIETFDHWSAVHFDDGSAMVTKYLIVADGVHSRARQQIVPGSAPRFAGQTCWRGVVEHPDLGNWSPSETWGIDGRFGIVPLTGNRVYWFVVVAQCLKHTENVERGFRDFEKKRLKRTHWVVNTSWKVGKVAQLDHPVLVGLRNAAFRMMPESASKRQFRKIEEVEFATL